jgi:hypothetical protein
MKQLQTLAVMIAMTAFSIQAQASEFDITLTGTASQGSPGSFVSGGTEWDYTFWTLSSTQLPITVNNNDEIVATINFDQNITIPSSLGSSSFLFAITGDAIGTSGYNTASSSTTQLIENTTTIFDNTATPTPSTTSGQFSGVTGLDPTQSYTFNQIIETISITDTSGNTNIALNQAEVYYMNSSPAAVPLPPAVIMFASGLIGLGAMRQKKSIA